MIYFERHVPEVYVNESRDFQLFLALLDLLQNGTKFRIDKMCDIIDTDNIMDNLLPLLQNKLGFFGTYTIPSSHLRVILRGFQTAVRNKGSKIGVTQAVNLFLNAVGITAETSVRVDSEYHIVYIATDAFLPKRDLLDSLLEYIIPAGFGVEYTFLYSDADTYNLDVSSIVDISDKWTTDPSPSDNSPPLASRIYSGYQDPKVTENSVKPVPVNAAQIASNIKIDNQPGEGEET